MNISANDFVAYANDDRWIGIPYAECDCQAFVEKMLAGVGIRKNWRGSNHMWREAVSDRKEKNCAALLPGEWLFTIRHDGGERERGYNDGYGNAVHVGIYLGNGKVIHSSTGGVQYGEAGDSRWTHSAKCNYLCYDEPQTSAGEWVGKLKKVLKELEDVLNELSEIDC